VTPGLANLRIGQRENAWLVTVHLHLKHQRRTCVLHLKVEAEAIVA